MNFFEIQKSFSAALQLQTSSCTPVTGNLSGLNLAPGVYCLDAVAKEGTLTLTGPANGVWVFLVNGALTGTNFSVAIAGGGVPCNVYWAPTAAATLTTSAFKGSILAGDAIDGSITLTGGSVAGSLLANVAVTMTDASVIGCDTLSGSKDKEHNKCNQGVGNVSRAVILAILTCTNHQTMKIAALRAIQVARAGADTLAVL